MRYALFFVAALFGCSLQKGGLEAVGDASDPAFDAGGTLDVSDASGPVDAIELPEAVEPSDSAAPEPETAVADSSGVEDAAGEAEVATDGSVTLPGCVAASYGLHDYLICERDANWDQAHTACLIAGYDLVVIDDEAESAFLIAAITVGKKDAFSIGLDDIAKEGEFVWVDSTTLSYKRWGGGEPNDFFGEDCTIMKRDGSWNDVDCTDEKTNAFICESK